MTPLEIATQHFQAGRLDAAAGICRQILARQPNEANALLLLGVALHRLGNAAEGEECLRRAIAIVPSMAEWHNALGNILQDLSRTAEAIEAYRRAIELNPALADAFNNLGNALRTENRWAEAAGAFERAIELRPQDAAPHNGLGNVHQDAGRPAEAVREYETAWQLDPGSAEACCNLGLAWRRLGQLPEALAWYRQALALDPHHGEVFNQLGTILKDQGHLDEAIECYRRALAAHPGSVGALVNLSAALIGTGRQGEALDCLRQAVALHPHDAALHSALVFSLQYEPGGDRAAMRAEGALWEEPHGAAARRFSQPHRNRPDPERRLRIGYVSPDFRDHVVGRNFLPLLTHHDREAFEIHCYAGGAPDTLTPRFQELADAWCDTTRVSDSDLAERIRADGIDLLVDLAQHTAGNRLPVFARQPAPVQISFMGYPESTGLRAIGHRLSDRYLETELAAEGNGAEQVALLDTFWCYAPPEDDPKPAPSPAAAQDWITFGCLANFAKVNEGVLALWAGILRRVAGSRLLLLSHPGSHCQAVQAFFTRQGIAASRIEFAAVRPRREYLALYRQIDIVLDTFPYNGHTTSLDALWMGVPVVSLAGPDPLSRAGWSHLNHLGLAELVAWSGEEYEETAVRLATDPARLAELRGGLRARMQSSILMDAPRWTRSVEQAYRAMWQNWCAAAGQRGA